MQIWVVSRAKETYRVRVVSSSDSETFLFSWNILWGYPDSRPGRLADCTYPAGTIGLWISIFWIFSIFKVLFALNVGLIQRMLQKWTFCQQLLRMPSKIFFDNLIDLPMSPKTFISNMMASKFFFSNFEDRTKIEKIKGFRF